ncbi:MAG: hypothetical protein EAZ78_17945 [Oscillatoriales cyanobacterium]|nr:MAG: hypothetical protein EA000_13070 [Oscillatoriales cyanobacterium]TAD93629.1 MAG: hypothetical protein EAZ98_22140 [Oscillatoriales cyanobacterium]TAE00931.1 MAG: hypothetical protein EAZ96_20225 [Oscillatoriales cyanobacterium]TAF01542.1 MAG: hypothetical protein EAZ78_17945 [Oscillatoriales cyanobacterium]TAF35998.1 MAG: hypothetical protein EAZ68_17645 [Oscillatoriales cyanobacterium]
MGIGQTGNWEWGMGHGALGIGHRAWELAKQGIGHGAWGIGNWATNLKNNRQIPDFFKKSGI